MKIVKELLEEDVLNLIQILILPVLMHLEKATHLIAAFYVVKMDVILQITLQYPY